MSKHHSFEEKLKYMKLLDEGYPMRQLSRETKIVRSRARHNTELSKYRIIN